MQWFLVDRYSHVQKFDMPGVKQKQQQQQLNESC